MWKRARSAEKKAERECAILNAAAALLTDHRFESITLRKIASAAGFTRSNVYRYFKTREEIYLRLYMDAIAEWVTHLSSELKDAHGRADVAHIAKVMAASLKQCPRVLLLGPLLSSVLENNCSEESLVKEKTRLSALIMTMHEGMAVLIPGVTPEQTFEFAMHFHCLVSGLWPAANPNPTLAKVLGMPQLSHLRVEFEPTLQRGLEPLLERLVRESS